MFPEVVIKRRFMPLTMFKRSSN